MKKSLLGVAALALVSQFAVADELIVSTDSSSKSRLVALDYVSTGEAVAFEFKIPVGEDAVVDFSNGVADAPKSHAGQCGFGRGIVTCLVFSDSNEKLQAGVLRIGTISVRGGNVERLAVSHFAAFDGQARPVTSTIRADGAKK